MKQWYQIVTDESGKMYLQTEDYSLASELSDWDYIFKVVTEESKPTLFSFELYNNNDEPVQVMNKIIKWRLEEPNRVTDFDYMKIDNVVRDLKYLMAKVYPKELCVVCYDYSSRMDVKIISLLNEYDEDYTTQRTYEFQPYAYSELERIVKDTCDIHVTRIVL